MTFYLYNLFTRILVNILTRNARWMTNRACSNGRCRRRNVLLNWIHFDSCLYGQAVNVRFDLLAIVRVQPHFLS